VQCRHWVGHIACPINAAHVARVLRHIDEPEYVGNRMLASSMVLIGGQNDTMAVHTFYRRKNSLDFDPPRRRESTFPTTPNTEGIEDIKTRTAFIGHLNQGPE
jgi:hypothetical protein